MTSEREWNEYLRDFADGSIYQTWSYGDVTWGGRKSSHLILKKDGCAVALAQVRIFKLPLTALGIAYVRWGPIWRRWSAEGSNETFRQAVRALRNEFTCKRGLVLRLFPALSDDDGLPAVLNEEGFAVVLEGTPSRTILLDMRLSLEQLRHGMTSHWKRELKSAERKRLEVIEGDQDELFEAFIRIYKEMVSRKKFVEPNDINKFRSIQTSLPDDLKMKIALCKSEDDVCAGMIYSAIGDTAVYLFGATSNTGMKSGGSYLLQWRLLETLKRLKKANYNLNGINQTRNPGTYKFKSGLSGTNGRELNYAGRFESHPGTLAHLCLKGAERIRMTYRGAKADWTKSSLGRWRWNAILRRGEEKMPR